MHGPTNVKSVQMYVYTTRNTRYAEIFSVAHRDDQSVGLQIRTKKINLKDFAGLLCVYEDSNFIILSQP
jgi:hypothetical protein